jgi:hypothetical protein
MRRWNAQAGVVPEDLDALAPEERHKLYKMLRLEVRAYPDESLEASGAILAGGGEEVRGRPDGVGPDGRDPIGALPVGVSLGASGPTQTRESQNTRPSVLRFRASLAEAASEVELVTD